MGTRAEMKPKSKWPGRVFGTLIGLFFIWLALGAPLPWDRRLPPLIRLTADYLHDMAQTRPKPP